MKEFDTVGRDYLLAKYGFGKPREYTLRNPDTARLYEVKAIIGATYGFTFPGEGPLCAEDFPDGKATVEQTLTKLGFSVVRIGQDWTLDEVALTKRIEICL